MALEIFPAHQQALSQVSVPQHVAIIMDGNGRWAENQYKPRLEGHRAGTERIRAVMSALGRRGVRYVTVYAFSTENWGRPTHEVNGLMELLQSVIHDEVPKLHEQNVRILHLGSRERFSSTLNGAIGDAVRLTAANTGLTLCVAFDYGGRAEIVEAVRRIVDEGTPAAAVTEETIREHLSLPGVPDPDLIIRTAGEQRLSNFLIWQGAYAELYCTPTFWPDFDDVEVDKALEAYQQRQRRFGKLHGEG
jgi:undecaprenyl diphosphate synthase